MYLSKKIVVTLNICFTISNQEKNLGNRSLLDLNRLLIYKKSFISSIRSAAETKFQEKSLISAKVLCYAWYLDFATRYNFASYMIEKKKKKTVVGFNKITSNIAITNIKTR